MIDNEANGIDKIKREVNGKSNQKSKAKQKEKTKEKHFTVKNEKGNKQQKETENKLIISKSK